MSKIRVHELAKIYNISSKDLIRKLQKINILVTNHMSILENENIELIKSEIGQFSDDISQRLKTNQPVTNSKKIDSWVNSIQGTLFEIKNENIDKKDKELEQKSIIKNSKIQLNNPYMSKDQVGGSDAFVGRISILRNIQRLTKTSSNDNALILYGQRRIGKTSILYEIEKKLSKKNNNIVIYINLHDKASLSFENFIKYFNNLLISKASIPTEFINKQEKKNDLIESGYDFFSNFIKQLSDDKSVIFLFDEFNAIDRPIHEQTVSYYLPYFKKIISLQSKQIKFIFVISKKPEYMSSIYLSLFKGIKQVQMTTMTNDETEMIIRLSEKNKTLKWSEDTISKIQTYTGGHPYITQLLCHSIWKKIYEDKQNSIPAVQLIDIEDVISKTMNNSSNFFQWIWDDFKPSERVVASALAVINKNIINQEDIEEALQKSGVSILIGELQNAPKKIEESGFVIIEKNNYKINFEIFRKWIIENKPLTKINKEMDRNLLIAENLFQAAYRLYQGSEFLETKELLIKTLEHNSNHMKANELLAEIYLAQGELTEAINLLEKLYKYNPIIASSLLVEAYLLQSRKKDSENDKLSLFEKIIEMDPDNIEANASYKDIWEKRGDNFFNNNNFNEALDAYQKTGLNTKIEKAQTMMQIDTLYNDALSYLEKNNTVESQKLLSKVLSFKPDFREASRYMHLAVTGIDINEIKIKLDDKILELNRLIVEKNQLIKKIKELEVEINSLRNSSAIKDKLEIEQEKIKLKNLQIKLKNLIDQSVEKKKVKNNNESNNF